MKKKLAIGCGVIAVLAVAVIIGVCAFAGNEVTKDRDVRYEVTGSAQRVDVTYQTGDGTSQAAGVSLPWSYEFKGTAMPPSGFERPVWS